MGDFTSADKVGGLAVKLWRGERMCLVGMDVDAPEPDLVGFSIEVRSPGNSDFVALRNRLNFSYDKPAAEAVDGFRNFLSTEAPFQRFRWIHFPLEPKGGSYRYRVTKQHMKGDGTLNPGTSVELDISLEPIVYDNFLEVGFTRNFASSQAYVEKYKNNPKIIPASASQGLEFQKLAGSDVYQWLGFEAYELIFGFLEQVAADPAVELDVFAYDLNEPDIVASLEKIGGRLRAIIDSSGDHGGPTSAESKAAARLAASAGPGHVKRMHFQKLQHNKVLIARKAGQSVRVLLGSTNFSFRGLYIQANNALLFHAPEAAALFGKAFELAFQNPAAFAADPIASQWHVVQVPGKPEVQLCFSPHASSDLSLTPIADAIDHATSSVFFSIAFLNQIESGPTREAIDRLMGRQVFSYGISDHTGGLEVRKPDGSIGLVDFAYLASKAPEPFRTEWSGGPGVHLHHKFVVTDFKLPTAKVFTGSSNLSPSGETGNGDNLVMVEDGKVATSYAIEALRVFDHLHFRSRMQETFGAGTAAGAPKPLTLKRPTAQSGAPAWFADYYQAGTQAEKDRRLFSS